MHREFARGGLPLSLRDDPVFHADLARARIGPARNVARGKNLRYGVGTKDIQRCFAPLNMTGTLIPGLTEQRARLFHARLPDLHHFFIVSLVQPAVVAVLKMFPH